MKFVGDFKGYNIYSLTSSEYQREHQYDEGKVFCITDRSDKLMLNGAHIGYADLKRGTVQDWHPERAPKTWQKPGKKAVEATKKKQKQKENVAVTEEKVVPEAVEADERYQRVMADLDRKYEEMMKRLDERVKV